MTTPRSESSLDRALRRIVGELCDGLRHGFFEYTLTYEVIGQSRRRVTLKAGKSYQFVIAEEECAERSKVEPRLPDREHTE